MRAWIAGALFVAGCGAAVLGVAMMMPPAGALVVFGALVVVAATIVAD